MNHSSVPVDNKSIFVSKKLTSISHLSIELNALGYHVIAEPLIKIEKIRFTHTPKTDWIFFSSQNAIQYFFIQNPELSTNVKYAVLSQSSADFLLKFDKKADFIGEGVDVTQIAKDFAKVVNDESVLFPQAIDSLQSVQKHLSFTNACHNLFVYKTSIRKDFDLPIANVLAFTSPSNVEAYFEKYKLIDGQKTVAIGSTTAFKLRSYGIKNTELATAFNDIGLLEAIKKQLQSTVSGRAMKHA